MAVGEWGWLGCLWREFGAFDLGMVRAGGVVLLKGERSGRWVELRFFSTHKNVGDRFYLPDSG